ncbi:hypothetical protein [Pseudomonas koreensis]|uniref:hypothetical protein n=1 Tax=Pseudomonas koreensis TaxID=198620 RepID=UPI001472F65F|nr:hypothetical protein [Pseudomonas koreensis]NNA54254.1 hypothetical protein [Pseudomonas koreensis]
MGCLIALLNAWLICSRLRASSPQALAGVRVSPTAANAPDDFDGRFIVSVCLRKSLALYESHTTTKQSEHQTLKNAGDSNRDAGPAAGIEEAHGDAGS